MNVGRETGSGENMLKNPHELAIGEVESKKEEIDNYFLTLEN